MCVKRILFLILKYLPFQFSYIRKSICSDKSKSFVNTPMLQGSRLEKAPFSPLLTLLKKFFLKIPSVNVTKSSGICGFGYIYWKNP